MARLDALIMPSAVAPSPKTPFQALVNPQVRLQQTIKAINYWVKVSKKYNFQILVADNTGFADQIRAGLASTISQYSKLQIIDVPPVSEADTARGKGAGETSTLIASLAFLNLPPHSLVAKVNARYITTNGMFLIDELEDNFDFAAWPRPRFDSVDTTFFLGRVDFLEKAFKYVYEATDDLQEKFVENLYADFSIRNEKCNFIRFNYSPAIKGQSGTTGSNASPFNEFRMVSFLVRKRKSLRKALYFLKPKYQRGLK